MRFYRIPLAALALLMLSATTTPALAAQDATPTDTAQQAAETARLAACATPVAPGTPVTISGNAGVSQSLPFTLDQPSYSVTWSLAAPSDRVTFMTLESPTGAIISGSTLVNASGGESVTSGQTAIYKLKPGSYYLSVRAPSSWSVTFTPLAV
jgi:hypothetical protein